MSKSVITAGAEVRLATAAGTAAYVAARGGQLAGSGRRLGRLHVSPIGCGSYRARTADDVELIVRAVAAGCNLIDSSNHYTGGASEAAVGAALERIEREGIARRDQLVVCTKLGHVDEAHLASPKWAGGSRAARQQTSGSPVGGYHCIHPDLLAEQLAVSTARLGTAPDLVLLHNPEYFFTDRLYAQNGQPDKPAADREFYELLEGAFGALERMVAAGSIGSNYGVSSNLSGCWWSVSGRPNNFEATSLSRMVSAAQAAGGAAHSFAAVQIPLNLFEIGGALAYSEDRDQQQLTPSALRQAAEHGIGVMSNRPLAGIPPVSLRRALPAGHVKIAGSEPAGSIQAALGVALRARLRGRAELADGATLAQLGLWVTASTLGVDVCLSGVRKPEHVADVARVMAWPRLAEHEVWELYDAAQDVIDGWAP